MAFSTIVSCYLCTNCTIHGFRELSFGTKSVFHAIIDRIVITSCYSALLTRDCFFPTFNLHYRYSYFHCTQLWATRWRGRSFKITACYRVPLRKAWWIWRRRRRNLPASSFAPSRKCSTWKERLSTGEKLWDCSLRWDGCPIIVKCFVTLIYPSSI